MSEVANHHNLVTDNSIYAVRLMSPNTCREVSPVFTVPGDPVDAVEMAVFPSDDPIESPGLFCRENNYGGGRCNGTISDVAFGLSKIMKQNSTFAMYTSNNDFQGCGIDASKIDPAKWAYMRFDRYSSDIFIAKFKFGDYISDTCAFQHVSFSSPNMTFGVLGRGNSTNTQHRTAYRACFGYFRAWRNGDLVLNVIPFEENGSFGIADSISGQKFASTPNWELAPAFDVPKPTGFEI